MQISSYLLFNVNNGFLNGEGSVKAIKGDITRVKQFLVDGISRPYVSTQAWRKWLRDSFCFIKNQYPYHDRINNSLNKKKLESGELLVYGDPVEYIEDDLFGYSRPFIDTPNQTDPMRYDIVSTNRQSVFNTSSILPLSNNASIDQIEGFVHLDDDTPLPYKNQFMNGFFFANTTLDVDRIGKFVNTQDIFELDPLLVDHHISNKTITLEKNDEIEIFSLIDRRTRIDLLVEGYLTSLLSIYPNVKASQFAVDMSPKVIITVLLNGSSNILTNLVTADEYNNLYFDVDRLEKLVNNRGHLLISDIYIGYRSGTFNSYYEEKLKSLNERSLPHKNGEIKIYITTPGEVSVKIKTQIGVLLK